MEIFRDRISRVQRRMAADSILVLPAAEAKIRNRDTHFPFRTHSDLLYLTGVNEEELSLILTNEAVHVFAQVRNPERERWVGRVKGHEFFEARLGKISVHGPHELEKQFAELVRGKKTLYYDFGAYGDLDQRLFRMLHEMGTQSRRGVVAPGTVVRSSLAIDECRLFKDAHDIDCMRAAAKISGVAHNKAQDAIESASAGVDEFAIKALIEHEFMKSGADRLAYPSIVAAGANATILHYEGSDGKAKPGEFILIDAGCEYQGYASDITRTTIAGGKGKATPLQRDLYDAVLAAQKAAIQKTQKGNSVDEVHQAAIDVLVQGLLDLGFFEKIPLRVKDDKGETKEANDREGARLTRVTSLDEIRELEYYRYFYMHRTSHYLGLDVHDVGDYFTDGKSRPLKPGMVITVEPGLYFPEECDFIRKEARGIGIRIEDDVLITPSGNEVLTSTCRS